MGIVKYFICVAFFTNAVFASSCPTGYAALDVEKHIDTTYHTFAESTFMGVEDGLCKNGGYSIMDVPYDVIAIYNGFTAGATATLCDDGYLVNNGSCVSYTNGSCESGDNDLALNSASFMGLENGLCKNGGYSIMNIPYEGTYPIYNGFTVGAEITLCQNGYLVNNSSCTTYANGDCPTDYLDLALNANTMTTLTNGVCASSYSPYTINQQCDENTDDAICGILCSDGLNYTDIGTCAALCAEGYTTLRTSTGLIIPVYATKQITPSLNIRGETGNVCYVNLMPGTADNAINFRYNNTTYHTVK